MDELLALRAENQRLRDLLIDNGLEPDPLPPEPEQFGPPTELMWKIQRMLTRSAEAFAAGETERLLDRNFCAGLQWGAEFSTLRVRKPVRFEVLVKSA